MDFTPYLGLARTPDACMGTQGSVVNETTDKTLLYLDDVAEVPLKRLGTIASWANRNAARAKASLTLNADLTAFLGSTFQSQPLYSGEMGKPSYTTFVKPESQTLVRPLSVQQLLGGNLVLQMMGLIVDTNLTDQVITLYKNDVATDKTFLIPTITARTTTKFSIPSSWSIPLDGNRYELRTTLPSDTIKVGNNQLQCGGCGGMPNVQYMLQNCCSGQANGWLLFIKGSCQFDPILQQLIEHDRTRLVLAYMLAYWTGYVLCATPPSGKIERDTVLSASDLAAEAAICKQEYLNRLNWLKVEVPKLTDLVLDGTCFKKTVPFGWSRMTT